MAESDVTRAESAQARFDFESAFRYFSFAAQRLEKVVATETGVDRPQEVEEEIDRAGTLWMKAARARDMSETWRSRAGTWEWLGNFFGQAIGDDPNPAATGHRYVFEPIRQEVARFYVIGDGEWDSARPAVDRSYPQGDIRAIRQHKRAWAYTWGAEGALAHGEFAAAARLFRRAGVAWEKSAHGDRCGRAARWYFEGAMAAAKTTRAATRRMIYEPWCPSCLREGKTEENCPDKDRHGHVPPGMAGEQFESDVDRLRRCSAEKQAGLEGEALGDALDEEARLLTALQRQLAAEGDRRHAIDLYRSKRNVERRGSWVRRRWAEWLLRRMAWVSQDGTNIRRFLLVLAGLYLVVTPFLWAIAGTLDTGRIVGPGPIAIEAVVFSLSSILTLSTGHFPPGSWPVTLFQCIESVSAFFSLGYVLWIMQRSYDT